MSGRGRTRHRLRWLLAGVALLVVLVVGGTAIFVKSQPSAAPLTLPSAAARPPVGPPEGTWDVASSCTDRSDSGGIASLAAPRLAPKLVRD